MRIWIYATVLLLFLSPLTSCEKSEVANLYSPQEWRDLLEEAGGWAPLVFPDSKYEPGSIIQVKKSGIRWIDHLSSCRYPPEAISPKEGLIPNIRFTSSWEIDASAMLNIKNISAGPQFDKVKKVHLAVQDHGADAFHLIRFRIWQQDPANRDKFSPLCMDELAKPDHYLVTEAFRISRASYTLFDQKGVALKLDAPLVKNILDIKPEVKYSTSSDGALIIEEPVYLAVRNAVRVGDSFDVLGEEADEAERADSMIKQLFIGAH